MRPSVFIAFLFCFAWLPGQDMGVLNQQARHFRLLIPEDTIDFIKVDTSLDERKPVLLFCQGSLPIPLFIDLGDRMFMAGGGISNFDWQSISKDYHLVVISMPKTPLTAKKEHLGRNNQYLPDPDAPWDLSWEFLKADHMDNYVRRGRAVLNYLLAQDWVDPTRLVLAGHSQGARVATGIARETDAVTHLGLFGANPFGRIDELVRRERQEAMDGQASWKGTENSLRRLAGRYRDAQIPDSATWHPEYRALKSFSEPMYDDWIDIEIPIYLCYGTEDFAAELCDLMPFWFIAAGKDHLTLKRYPGWNHNFMNFDDEGMWEYHWEEVMDAFVEWLEQ